MHRLEATSLGEVPCEADRDRQPHEREQVHEAPALVAEVGQLECGHGDEPAQSGGHGQHADGVGAAVAGHVFCGRHRRQQGHRDAQWPCNGLGDDEQPEGGGQCAQRAEQGREPGEQHDRAAATDAIGEHRERQGDDHPQAHDGATDALPAGGHAEAVGSEVGRLGEQRVREGGGAGCHCQQRQCAHLPFVEAVGWRPPRVASAGGPASAQSAPQWPCEEPPEPREVEAIGDGFGHRAVGVGEDLASIVAERAHGLGERAVCFGVFVEHIGAWL